MHVAVAEADLIRLARAGVVVQERAGKGQSIGDVVAVQRSADEGELIDFGHRRAGAGGRKVVRVQREPAVVVESVLRDLAFCAIQRVSNIRQCAGCTSRGNALVLRRVGVRVGDGCVLGALGVIHRARDIKPIRTILGNLNAARLGVVPECVAVDNEVRAVGIRSEIPHIIREFVDCVAAEEAEGNASRGVGLDRAGAVIGVAPAAGRHAFVDELCGSRKVGVQRCARSGRAAAGLCAVERCRTDIARAGDGHGGSRGRGQNDDTVIRRGALDVVAVLVGHIAAIGVLGIGPMERAAVADGDAGDLRAVAGDQRETERIVAVVGVTQDVVAIEVHAFDVEVDRYAKAIADGVVSLFAVDSCESAYAQSEEHHNCQKDCCELFHSSFLLLYFPGSVLPAQSGGPARNAHSVSRFSRALLRSGFI